MNKKISTILLVLLSFFAFSGAEVLAKKAKNKYPKSVVQFNKAKLRSMTTVSLNQTNNSPDFSVILKRGRNTGSFIINFINTGALVEGQTYDVTLSGSSSQNNVASVTGAFTAIKGFKVLSYGFSEDLGSSISGTAKVQKIDGDEFVILLNAKISNSKVTITNARKPGNTKTKTANLRLKGKIIGRLGHSIDYANKQFVKTPSGEVTSFKEYNKSK
jgi:hypothetical protein